MPSRRRDTARSGPARSGALLGAHLRTCLRSGRNSWRPGQVTARRCSRLERREADEGVGMIDARELRLRALREAKGFAYVDCSKSSSARKLSWSRKIEATAT